MKLQMYKIQILFTTHGQDALIIIHILTAIEIIVLMNKLRIYLVK